MSQYQKIVQLGLFLFMITMGYSEQNQPNVLLILTDDQGYGDLSLHGNPHLETPHLDALGRKSVRFDRFYVNSVCAPSRASILTGRYAVRTGVFSVTRNGEAIKPSEVTLGEAFKSSNYSTSFIGKWHSGTQYPCTPIGQGFDEFFGFTGGHINNYFDATLLRGAEPVKTKGYITDVLTDEAIGFISKKHKQPFFCHVSYNAPHSPYQVPDKYFDKYKQLKLKDKLAATWGMCESIDDNVGRLLKALEEQGLTENTIVLFLTDNGGVEGARFFNAGMKGRKTSTFEGGSRVPLFFHWPKAKWKPKVVEKLTAHIDLFPTLMDLCEITPPKGPKLDGISLVPLLKGESDSWSERVLCTHNGIDEKNRYPGAVRTERYRLNCLLPGPNAGSAAKNLDAQVGAWELYDMKNDPGQKKNLAEQMPEKVAELIKHYEAWIDDTFSEGRSRMPLPVGFSAHNPVSLHASQAFFDEPIRYKSGRGYANDWLTGWDSEKAKVWFEMAVAQDGVYEIGLEYACEADGVTFKVSADQSSCEAKASVALAPEMPIANRVPSNYIDRDWGKLKVGTIKLKKGLTHLKIEAQGNQGKSVVDFKSIALKRLQ